MNSVAEQLDQETKDAVLKEGVMVFKMNNTIISSVKGVNR